AQHDVESLVPRTVLQTQGHVAGYRVADDDVLATRIGEQLQNGAGIDLLEVECQALTGIRRLVVLSGGSLVLRLDLHDVLVIGLISELLVVAARVDGQPGPGADARGIERADRRAEVARGITGHTRI